METFCIVGNTNASDSNVGFSRNDNGSRKNLVPRNFVNLFGLTSNQRLINRDGSLNQNAIGRDLVSGLIDNDVVENDLLHFDIYFFAVSDAANLWVGDKLKLINRKPCSDVGDNADDDVTNDRNQEKEVRKSQFGVRHQDDDDDVDEVKERENVVQKDLPNGFGDLLLGLINEALFLSKLNFFG